MNDSFNPPPQRALVSSSNADTQPATGFERAMGAMRMAIPFVQRLLPLLDGNVGSAASNLLNPLPPPPPAPPVNLEPIEDGLAAVQAENRALRTQVIEQNLSLKRVEEQLGMMAEASDRIVLTQQKMTQEIKAVGRKVAIFASIVLALLVIFIACNVILFLRYRRLLPY